MNNNRIRILISVLELLILGFIVVGIPLYIYFNHYEWIIYFKSQENINLFLEEYKTESLFIYFGLQIMQVVICIIPGQALQFVAGYAFPFWLGLILAMAGVTVGTICAYWLSRLLGRKALYIIFGEKKLNKFVDKLNTKRAYILIFVIFLIPGLPKDLFSYCIGLSEMKFRPFLFISIIARAPAMIVNIAMGVATRTGSYIILGILIFIIVIACVIGFLKHEKLAKWIDYKYNKFIKMNGKNI